MSSLSIQRKEALAAAHSIVDAAKAQGRDDLTPAEHDAVEERIAHIKELDRQLESGNLVRKVMGLGGVDREASGSSLFTDEDATGFLTAVKSKQAFRMELPTKAALTGGGLDLPAGGSGVIPGVYPSAAFPLSQLFNVESTESATLRYYVLGNASAAVVPELGVKPASGVTVTPKDVAVQKVATTVTFSDELSEDASFLLQFLQEELVNACVTTENQVVVTALGAASGISTSSGALATVIDLSATAIASFTALNGAPPDAMVVAPSVLGSIRSSKASTSGTYFVDPTAAAPSTLHGCALVPSMATPAGTAWLVGRSAATIFRRSQITAEIGWVGDQFVTNERTMRVEERLAVGVVRPSQVHKMTLT